MGETDINGVPFAVSGRRIGYVGPITYLFSTSVRDNLLLGLRHRPNPIADNGSDGQEPRARAIEEARKSGNSEFDVAADWVDYRQARVADAAGLEARIVEVLRLVRIDSRTRRSTFSMRVICSPSVSQRAVLRISSSGSIPIATTRILRFPSTYCLALRSDRFSKATGSLATPMSKPSSIGSGSLTTSSRSAHRSPA
jgi:hypothetical protein